jgi:methanethiol S-methyltransferase
VASFGAAKVVGIVFGALTQALFLWTVYKLYLFLRFGSVSQVDFSPTIDIALALFFAWPHSLLLLPSVNSRLRRILPGDLLGCVHCVATCVSLLILFALWRPSEVTLWRCEGWVHSLVITGFYLSWFALFYSVYLTGLGYQTGVLQWWYWVRDLKPPIRKFEPTSLYRWMRHPVYFSFLGLIWCAPHMTLDHAIMTVIWSVYIYVGSYLKDRRLLHYVGEPYREYARRVPGFPLIGFGPWGKLYAE